MGEPADDAVSPTRADDGIAERIELNFLKVVGVRRLALLLLVLLPQASGVEQGRADIQLALCAISKLFLEKQIVDGDAVVMPIVLYVFSCLLGVLPELAQLCEHCWVDGYGMNIYL
jgi:hypothetical protein